MIYGRITKGIYSRFILNGIQKADSKMSSESHLSEQQAPVDSVLSLYQHQQGLYELGRWTARTEYRTGQILKIVQEEIPKQKSKTKKLNLLTQIDESQTFSDTRRTENVKLFDLVTH